MASLRSLEDLWLYDNAISDIAPLAALTNLKDLWLDNNPISDLTPLMSLTSLTTLALNGIRVTDLSMLAGLTELSLLSLGSADIADVTPLASLTNLDTLWLDDNRITDVTPLATLTALAALSLMGNEVSDLTPLSGLTGLTDLYLDGNPIGDSANLGIVGHLANLQTLSLTSTGVTDVSPLANLDKLEFFWLDGNQVTDLSSLPLHPTVFADSNDCGNHFWVPGIDARGQTVTMTAEVGTVPWTVRSVASAKAPVEITVVSGPVTVGDGTLTFTAPGTAVIKWQADSENLPAECVVDDTVYFSGTLTVTVTAPETETPSGTDTPPGTETETGTTTPTPTLSITQDGTSKAQGAKHTVVGHGFAAGETVTGVLNSDPVSLGSVTAAADGTATFTFSIPANLATGPHTITLTGSQSGAVSATLTVTARTLPDTGAAPVGVPLYCGLLLLVFAGVFLHARRRLLQASARPA